MVVGGILIAGVTTTIAVMSGGDINFDNLPLLFALGMGLSLGGVAVIIPSGIKIGKSKKFMVVSP